jgi:O-antigen/teichoic acid export membrane protein
MRAWRIPYINNVISLLDIFYTRRIVLQNGSRFRHNFIKVASANAFSQTLSILVAPILTRLYSPADFGAAALFTALLGIVLAIATMRIDWLVSTVANNKKATNVFIIGVTHVIFVSLVILLIKFSGWYKLIRFVNLQLIDNYLWLLPVALIGSGIQLMLVGWFVRVADLAPIAATTVRQSIGGTLLNLLGGVLSFGAGGLILSATMRSWIGVIILTRRAWQTLGAYLQQTNPLSIRASFKKIWRKYAVSGSTGIVNTCGLLLPTVLISTYFTPVELGWYALMQSLATGPVGILTGALGQSFWAEARQLVKRDPVALRSLFLKTTKRLTLICLPVAIACLSGPFYVGPIFGLEKWGGAGSVLAALTPFISTQIIVSSLSPIIVICGKENWLFVWDVVRTILIISVFALAHFLSMQFIYAVSTFSILMAVMYIILFYKNLRLLNVMRLERC